ncbi:hypothetical protein K1T71_012765 [Dendrolimus kikuchii]|uniref:Uncharacterized protein n=1 Tax=Dendrolimus kikuchii TaxID=765133 RepID=A0ACC1CKJ0_9NEOP|nr:hypothetical protein K1T71_012765 [Dendrolimus kikuchii]
MPYHLANKEEQIKIRNDFDDSYYAILTHLSKLKLDDEHCRHMSRSIGLSDSFHGNSSSPKLPKLPLPSFSGNSTDWNSFYDLYLSLIHNNNAYTDAEKFRYLLLTLKNEPYDLIKSIPITDANYNIALHILVSRYENKRVIANTHLHKILDIEPCSDKSTISLRNLLNIYHENIRPLQVMRFPTNEWSFILLTILLRKIPLSIRKRYELSLQSPSDIPDIDTLINFLERELSANEISSSNCNISHRFFSKEGSNTKNVSLQRGPLLLGDRSHTFATNIGPNWVIARGTTRVGRGR